MMEAGDGTDQAQGLTGEYSAKELFVSLVPLAGPYTVTLTDATGKVVYEKQVQTSNVVALNTDLTKYADGTYTLTVENAEEAYTAALKIGEADGIQGVEAPQPLSGSWYDLSGRRLPAPRARGLYLHNGRKVVRW